MRFELKQTQIVMIKYFIFFLTPFLLVSCKNDTVKIKVSTENITESVYASGIVKSKNQYNVYATVNGIIQEIYKHEGDEVSVGTPILKLQNDAANFNVENAKLAFDNADLKNNAYKLNDLKIGIDLARTKMRNDSLLFSRQKYLWAQKIGSMVELEQRELMYKSSLTAYQSAILKYNDAKKNLNFLANQSSNILKINSTTQNDFIVKSQVNGRIYNLLKEKGEIVNPQTPIAVVGDGKEFVLELQIDEYDIVKIKEGQKVLVNMDSYKGKVFEAKVKSVDPMMDERSRSFKVIAEFVTNPEILFPNLTVEANIVIQTKENVITIPREYLVNDSFVMNENKEKVRVIVGLKDYQKVEILSGLSANDYILKSIK